MHNAERCLSNSLSKVSGSSNASLPHRWNYQAIVGVKAQTMNYAELAPYQPGKSITELERELGITDIVKLASGGLRASF